MKSASHPNSACCIMRCLARLLQCSSMSCHPAQVEALVSKCLKWNEWRAMDGIMICIDMVIVVYRQGVHFLSWKQLQFHNKCPGWWDSVTQYWIRKRFLHADTKLSPRLKPSPSVMFRLPTFNLRCSYFHVPDWCTQSLGQLSYYVRHVLAIILGMPKNPADLTSITAVQSSNLEIGLDVGRLQHTIWADDMCRCSIKREWIPSPR